jgi:hypothetical protein
MAVAGLLWMQWARPLRKHGWQFSRERTMAALTNNRRVSEESQNDAELLFGALRDLEAGSPRLWKGYGR